MITAVSQAFVAKLKRAAKKEAVRFTVLTLLFLTFAADAVAAKRPTEAELMFLRDTLSNHKQAADEFALYIESHAGKEVEEDLILRVWDWIRNERTLVNHAMRLTKQWRFKYTGTDARKSRYNYRLAEVRSECERCLKSLKHVESAVRLLKPAPLPTQ
jgi:hypothetical protein